MDSGIKCILRKLADDTKFCDGAVDTLEGRDNAIQTDLDRFERWFDANFSNFNKEKCKVLHLSHCNPRHSNGLGTEMIESSPGTQKEMKQQPQIIVVCFYFIIRRNSGKGKRHPMKFALTDWED
ncbi:hypothetical protein DUI87_18602 [Hirundo rustica rustica]|uniref:Rna-directed dna polymerase from mobile element jockey-like n=1 Tax=Hirundo rustica rustica TaxID=333673 RepID=A0A3M0JZ31_HIRRU|nr:hypothetical protein DUI87_18602 [Hirundo rustica rustica]